MKQIRKYTALLSCALLACTACVSYKKTKAEGGPAPANDSSEFRTASWREFFRDTVLLQLIDSALLNSPDLMSACQRIEMAAASAKAKHLALFPGVDAKAGAGQTRFGSYTMDGVGNYDTQFSPNITREQIIPEHLPDYFIGLQASWEIDIWKRLSNSRNAARARYLQEVEAKNWVISNLVAGVAEAYYELLILDQELLILEDFIRLQENAELIIGYQKVAGQATELAVQQFQAQTLSSKNMYLEIKQKVVEAENRLNVLLARFPGAVKRNPGALSDSLYGLLPPSLPRAFIRNRPDIAQAEHQLKEARLNVLVAQSSFYPRLSANALLGYQSFNAGFLFSPASITYNVLASLTAPLINRAQLKADLKIAGSAQKNVLYDYRKTVLNAYSEVSTELSNLRNLRMMYDLKSRENKLSNDAVETANALFRTGRATYLEVIITQKNALLTNLQLLELQGRSLKAGIRLYKALGGGWR